MEGRRFRPLPRTELTNGRNATPGQCTEFCTFVLFYIFVESRRALPKMALPFASRLMRFAGVNVGWSLGAYMLRGFHGGEGGHPPVHVTGEATERGAGTRAGVRGIHGCDAVNNACEQGRVVCAQDGWRVGRESPARYAWGGICGREPRAR